jgi:hypothetical protein
MQELSKAAAAGVEQKNKATTEYQKETKKDSEIGVGDKAICYQPDISSHQKTRKEGKSYTAKFSGPYEVRSHTSRVTGSVKAVSSPGTNAHPIFHAGLKPYFPDATGHRIPKEPEPVVVDGQI